MVNSSDQDLNILQKYSRVEFPAGRFKITKPVYLLEIFLINERM
jgi:hypothetical protein